MTLNARVAIVAGASRGAGRGAALALGECGATVYVTGRTTTTSGPPLDRAPGDYRGQIHWDLAHESINRMALGMSADGKQKNIAVVALNPGFMRTERVLMHLKTEAQKKMFGFDRSESTEYIGRAVASLAGDAAVMAKTGQILYVADLAQEYGFTDIDGNFVPRFDARPSE